MNNNLTEVKNSLTKKLIISFLVICTIAGIILSSVSYFRTKQYIWDLFSKLTTSCSVSIAHMLHDSRAPIDKYLQHQEMDSYNNFNEIMKDFSKSFGLKYLYVYVPDIENNKIIPIFGVEGETGKQIENFNLAEPPENLKLNDTVIDMFKNKKEKLTIEMNNEYGHVFTGYSPVLDENNNPIAIVGSDIGFNDLIKKLLTDCLIYFIFIFLALSILYLLGIFFIQKILIKPILQLSTEMTKYLHQDGHDSTPITLTTDDELNIIASLCNNIAVEKKRIESELNIARNIQLSALPRIFPPFPDNKKFDIFADMVAAKAVGGDFYDFFFIDDDNFAFLIADVCGKGVPAALFMMEAKSTLKNIIKTGVPIDEAITKANREICENNKQNYFVTAFIASINLNTGDCSFVNAGHNYPLIKRADADFEYYKSERNLVLGVMKDYQYKKTDIKVNKDDVIFLYTDGVTEAMNESEVLYGEERLKNVMNADKNLKIEEIVSELKKDIYKHSQNVEQSDDITTLIFKYNSK